MTRIDVRSASLDELALTFTQVGATIAGYQELGIDAPESLVGLQKDIKREANERVRTEREMKLKRAQAKRAAMLSPDEKRAAADAEIKALQDLLA